MKATCILAIFMLLGTVVYAQQPKYTVPAPDLASVRADDSQPLNARQIEIANKPVPKGSIEVSLQLVGVREDRYQANRDKIDTAVEKGDIAFFQALRRMGVADLLSIPSVTTLPGQAATIKALGEFRYPYADDKVDQVFVDKTNGMIPDPGATTTNHILLDGAYLHEGIKDVGVVAEFNPSLDHKKIILNGKLSVTDIKNFTRNNKGVFMATFTTNETPLLEALNDHQPKAIWLPGAHFQLEESSDLGIVSAWLYKERMILFFTASLVK